MSLVFEDFFDAVVRFGVNILRAYRKDPTLLILYKELIISSLWGSYHGYGCCAFEERFIPRAQQHEHRENGNLPKPLLHDLELCGNYRSIWVEFVGWSGNPAERTGQIHTGQRRKDLCPCFELYVALVAVGAEAGDADKRNPVTGVEGHVVVFHLLIRRG